MIEIFGCGVHSHAFLLFREKEGRMIDIFGCGLHNHAFLLFREQEGRIEILGCGLHKSAVCFFFPLFRVGESFKYSRNSNTKHIDHELVVVTKGNRHIGARKYRTFEIFVDETK